MQQDQLARKPAVGWRRGTADTGLVEVGLAGLVERVSVTVTVVLIRCWRLLVGARGLPQWSFVELSVQCRTRHCVWDLYMAISLAAAIAAAVAADCDVTSNMWGMVGHSRCHLLGAPPD